MGFIKWIGLFSGFAQTQSVLGAIAGFVIGSVSIVYGVATASRQPQCVYQF